MKHVTDIARALEVFPFVSIRVRCQDGRKRDHEIDQDQRSVRPARVVGRGPKILPSCSFDSVLEQEEAAGQN